MARIGDKELRDLRPKWSMGQIGLGISGTDVPNRGAGPACRPRPHECWKYVTTFMICSARTGGLIRRVFLVGTTFLMASVILFAGECRAQGRNTADSDSPELPTVQSGQDTATIGSSGFKVPIPEIKMKRIVGDQPSQAAPPAEPKEKVRDGGKAAKAPEPKETTSPPRSPRLPFDPTGRRPVRGPRKGPQREPAVPPEEPPHPVAEQDLPPLPPAEEVTAPPTRGPSRGPVQLESMVPEAAPPTDTPFTAPAAPPAEPEPEKTGPVSERTERPRTAKEEDAQKESVPELLRPPRAPEDAVEPPPPPKKEILKEKAAPTQPVLIKAPRSKEERKPMTLDSAETDEMADPRGWIKLDERRAPEAIPRPEPEPAPEILPQPEILPGKEPPALPETQPIPKLQPQREPAVPTEPMPVPEQSPLDSSPKETLPREPGAETPVGKEALPAVQEPPAVREVLHSPLQDDVLESWEVKEYLRKAAPILEELSLLMARAPSLTIADYDPSDPNAPAVPGDVHPKMDSMKRTLQILDSKAFEIIPPKKYIPFHGLIRESIAETYKACDAITAYLDSNKPEDLQGVQEHLFKARELIQRTRERPQRG